MYERLCVGITHANTAPSREYYFLTAKESGCTLSIYIWHPSLHKCWLINTIITIINTVWVYYLPWLYTVGSVVTCSWTQVKGRIQIRDISVIAPVPQTTFGKDYCFQVSKCCSCFIIVNHSSSSQHLFPQVGNEAEVMYFATKTSSEREEWIKAFRKGLFCPYFCMWVQYIYDYRWCSKHK